MSIRIKAPPDELFQLATDVWTEPFWNAAREHRLVAPRCGGCGSFRMPPTPFCPQCRSQAIDWTPLSGRGTLFSYSIVAYPIIPAMEGHLPYVTAIVELPDAGGVRLVTNVVDSMLEDLEVGAALSIRWHDRPDGVSVPRFALA